MVVAQVSGKSGKVAATKTAKVDVQDVVGSLQERLGRLEDQLNKKFLEREDLIKGMLTMLIGKINLYAGGPPGTGKTALAKTLSNAFKIDNFYYLVGAQTEPSHLLGPIDLRAMKEEQVFQYDLEGMLAKVHLGILDEGFKGSDPCLNALLGLILDHGMRNGRNWVDSPLMSVIVCSNELPRTDRLAAFWDRLAIRFWVENVSWANRETLMLRRGNLEAIPEITEVFSLAELQLMQAAAAKLPMTRSVIKAANEICKQVADKASTLSTRKSEQVVDLLRAFAFVSGALQVEEEHVEILKSVLWEEPKQSKDINPIVNKVLSEAYESITETVNAAQAMITEAGNYPLKSANRQVFYEGTESRLMEIIDGLERLTKNSGRSKRGQVAQKALNKIRDLRQRHILPVLADYVTNR